MAKQLQLRRGTTVQHSTFTGALGEVTIDTNKDVVVVHDGTTAGGFPSQKELISGTNIKTINNSTILGSGNLSIGVSGLSDTSISSPLSGQVLSYDGVNWANVTFSALPSQSGQSGKYLTTDGSNASWATLNTSLYMNDDTIPVGSSQTIPTGKQIVVDHLDVQGTLDIQGTLATVTGGYLSQTTMKTQAITHTNGTNAMTIDSSGNVMLGSNYLTPYTGFKNRIINGAMVIDQRNAGASVTPASSAYTLDRWPAILSTASKFSVAQSTIAPAGFTNSVLITSTSAYSIVASDYNTFQHRIEANNMMDAGWGTANAQTFTLSFWVRSSLTGTFGGSLYFPATTTRTFPFSYVINSANTWEQKTITITGDTTSNTAPTTNNLYVVVQWSLGVGSTYTTATTGWQNGNFANPTGCTNLIATNGATFYITGVQLEKGSVATPFENRPYGLELSLCKRYFRKSFAYSVVPANGTTNTSFVNTENAVLAICPYRGTLVQNTIATVIPFDVEMRTVPTIVRYGNNNSDWYFRDTTVSGFTGNIYPGATTKGIYLANEYSPSYNGLAMGHYTASAEL